MSETALLLRDTTERLLRDHCTRATLEGCERGEWPAALWNALEAAGLPQALAPEAAGGAGVSWREALEVLRAAGRHAAPVPLAETLVATALLAAAELDRPSGPLALAQAEEGPLHLERAPDGWRARGRLAAVPWGRAASHVATTALLDDRPHLLLLRSSDASVRRGWSIAREPRDELVLQGAPLAVAPLPAPLRADAALVLGALARSAQMAGALERLLEDSVRHARERVQFGRPIGSFQAIQHALAVLAGETAAAAAATAAAARTAERGDPTLAVAAAKLRSGEAAGIGARIAHQVHGAIGFTYEGALHFWTRRLWAWRAEHGSERFWAERLGRSVAARGSAALWPDVTAGLGPEVDDASAERTGA
jgi:acyl-CoA dehydrogenase